MKRKLTALFLTGLIATAPSMALALEKNHGHRWSNDHHKRYKPLDMSAEDAQKSYDKSIAALDKSIMADDTENTHEDDFTDIDDGLDRIRARYGRRHWPRA